MRCVLFGFKQWHGKAGIAPLIGFDPGQILAGLAVLFLMPTALPSWATAYGAGVQRRTPVNIGHV
jgi:hypothetical protein